MAVDWDRELLEPVMGLFGEGRASDPTSWPIYQCKGGPLFRLAGAVFDENYADATLDGDGTDNATRKPCLGVRLSRFTEARAPAPDQGDKVFIPSTGGTYLVKEARPDGHGVARLILMGPMP